MKKSLSRFILAASLLLAGFTQAAQAQSEVSAAHSMLPLASVVGTASAATAGAAALSAAPLTLSAAGTVLTVQAVEASARGTVYLLERASDGARISVEVVGRGASALAAGLGTAVAVSVIDTGLMLSAAGELLAFIPNELGRALLHNERVTF